MPNKRPSASRRVISLVPPKNLLESSSSCRRNRTLAPRTKSLR